MKCQYNQFIVHLFVCICELHKCLKERIFLILIGHLQHIHICNKTTCRNYKKKHFCTTIY